MKTRRNGSTRSVVGAFAVAFLVAGASALFPACGEDEEGGDACTQAARHLQGCGVLSEGELGDGCEGISECQANCAQALSCDEADAVFCSMGVATAVPTAYQNCVANCSRCPDGLTQMIPCDGTAQCPDGSDEAGCLTCADGTVYSAEDQCDGFPDCGDGADEANCPMEACPDGTTMIPADSRCDSAADCPDGSDEAGCAMFCPAPTGTPSGMPSVAPTTP